MYHVINFKKKKIVMQLPFYDKYMFWFKKQEATQKLANYFFKYCQTILRTIPTYFIRKLHKHDKLL